MAGDVIWCLIYLTIIVLVGYAATSAILGTERRSAIEIAGLSLLLGAGAAGTLLILLSIVGIRPMRWVIVMIGVAGIAAIVGQARARRVAVPAIPNFDDPAWKELLLILPPIALLIGANLAAAIPTVSFDYFEWDAAVIWGFKAKVLHYQALLWHNPDYFHDVRLSFSHLDYPLLWPMILAGSYGAMGHPSEQMGKTVQPLLFVGQSLLAYSGARLWLGRFGSLMVALMFVGPTYAIIYSAHGSADSPLTAFYVGAIVYLIRWVQRRQRSDIVLAALFTGFVASTKSEGQPLAVSHMVVLLAVVVLSRQGRDWKDFGAFAGIVIAFVAFWVICAHTGLPHTHDDYASRLRLSIFSSNIGRIGTVLASWKTSTLNTHSFGLLWIALPIIALLGFRGFTTRESLVLWALLVLHLCLYMLVYVITDWDLNELLTVTSRRLLLHATPIAMMLIAVHWNATRKKADDSV